MYDQRFFVSKLGRSALLSIAAMITFAVFAGAQPHTTSPDAGLIGEPLVAPMVILA